MTEHRGSALVRRRENPWPGGTLVVVDGSGTPGQAPGWAAEWCRYTGRALFVEPVPARPRGDVTAVTAWVGTVVDRVAGAGLTGDAVLVVPEAAPTRTAVPLVVAAVRDLPGESLLLSGAAECAARMGGSLVVAHAVPASFGERSVGLDAAVERGRRVLDAAVDGASAAAPGLAVEPRLLRVHPHELVGEGLGADLLVIGGPLLHPASRLGLVTSSALHHAPCPVLLVPRPA